MRRFDLRSEPLPVDDFADVAPVMLANLLRPLLLELARAMPAVPRELLASGLLVDEVDEVARAFGERGLRERERRRRGEWAAVWLTSERS